MSKQRSTLLPKAATMSNEFCVEILSFRQSRTLLKLPKTAILSKQQAKKFRQCWFDIVASVDRALCHIWRPTMSDLATHNVNIVCREKCRPAVSADKAVSVTAGHECRPLYDIVGITKFSQYCTFVCAAVTDKSTYAGLYCVRCC